MNRRRGHRLGEGSPSWWERWGSNPEPPVLYSKLDPAEGGPGSGFGGKGCWLAFRIPGTASAIRQPACGRLRLSSSSAPSAPSGQAAMPCAVGARTDDGRSRGGGLTGCEYAGEREECGGTVWLLCRAVSENDYDYEGKMRPPRPLFCLTMTGVYHLYAIATPGPLGVWALVGGSLEI